MRDIYLDNSATTKPHQEVVNEVAHCMADFYANPSSAHKLGLEAEKKLKKAREKIAGLINAAAQEIIFTSGGSESNNTAILGMLAPGDHLVTTKIEHPSVLKLMKLLEERGHEVTYLNVDQYGIINPTDLENSIKSNTRLVSLIYVNNEVGSIQPIQQIAPIIRNKSKRVKIHLDAVQAVGKMPIDVTKLDIDMMSMSAHKIHGPKGVGALYLKRGLTLKPLVIGGDQESGFRSGTENLPAICGFGLAAEMAMDNMAGKIQHVMNLKKHFIVRMEELGSYRINSPLDEKHIPNILNISFPGIRGEVLLHALEDRGIYVSTGSACSAKRTGHRNYVLPAMGLKDIEADSAIRFSFSYMNTLGEVDETIDALKQNLVFLRRMKK